MEKKEITDIQDIRFLVDTFYGKIRKDNLLAEIFEAVIQDQWPEHLETMYTFWQTILLNERTYYGSPFPPHANLPVEIEHFQRWIKLFHETLNEHFQGELAEEAKWRSERMAEMFLQRIRYFKDRSTKPLI